MDLFAGVSAMGDRKNSGSTAAVGGQNRYMSSQSAAKVLRVRCQGCGPVLVRPERVRILLTPLGSSYAFTCVCGRASANAAPPRVVDALRMLGCTEQIITLPPRIESDAPPITADEVLDVWLALQQPGWEREVLA